MMPIEVHSASKGLTIRVLEFLADYLHIFPLRFDTDPYVHAE